MSMQSNARGKRTCGIREVWMRTRYSMEVNAGYVCKYVSELHAEVARKVKDDAQ